MTAISIGFERHRGSRVTEGVVVLRQPSLQANRPIRATNSVTTDGHDSYPRAIRTELGRGVRHRTSRYLNNRREQDHQGLKGRYRPMRGFKCPRSAARFCRGHDELRNFLRPRSRRNQHVPAARRRVLFLRRTATVLAILEAA